MTPSSLAIFFAAHAQILVAELTQVRGSSPREAGTFMLISGDALLGTIGGGALEYMVIDRARQVLRDGADSDVLNIPLGPEIGQCCGGRVKVSLHWVDADEAARLSAKLAAEIAQQPHVFIFGAGHVGRGLARALSVLPVKAHVIDTRPDELADLPDNVEAKAVAMPEAMVRSAPAGSSFVILTHDHALDFLIAAEALKRKDCPYLGMVGSKTKRIKFRNWYIGEGGSAEEVKRLILPIGAQGLGDKRPEVIAALAAAEIMVHLGASSPGSRRTVLASEQRVGAIVEH